MPFEKDISAESVIKITTIDIGGTKIREDGFYIDPETECLTIAAYIPNESFEIKERIGQALREQWVKKPEDIHFFKKEAERGFSHKFTRDAILVHFDYDWSNARVTVGKVIIRASYSFEEAEIASSRDSQLVRLCAIFPSALKEKLQAKTLVHLLVRRLNEVCYSAFKTAKIPFLGRLRNGIMVVNSGTGKVTPPLRDALAYINSRQLSHYLKSETGEILFSKKDLARLIKH